MGCQVVASTKSLSDWVATTCQQGAEASRITAAALHESEEARRFLEADVRRLAEQHERLDAEVGCGPRNRCHSFGVIER